MQGAGGGGEGGRRARTARRTGRYQHGQDDPEGSRRIELPPQQANGCAGHQREQQEPLRGAVGNLGQARFFRLGSLQQAHDG